MTAFLTMGLILAGATEGPVFGGEFVFDPGQGEHGHVHASCLVECPNGDLRAVWYENGPALPPPHFSEQKDKSDDVRVGGARKPSGSGAWEPPFVMHDTFGVSDNNPCMVVDKEGRLWLVHGTLLGVPKLTWGSALVQYHIASKYDHPGPPKWDRDGILVPHPTGIEGALKAPFNLESFRNAGHPTEEIERGLEEVLAALDTPLLDRVGWMPRAHPFVRSDGAVLFPLANENFLVAAMAITKDGGDTWQIGNLVPAAGIEQPTVVEFDDGAMMAFFRNNFPQHRILQSESKDGGVTWSPPAFTELAHPGAGIEAITLKNGHLAIIYNDKEDDPRDSLAVSISEDRGKTWRWTRHIEAEPGGRFDYPSMIQAKDGTIHASYTYNLKTIKHVWFDEAWVRAGA